MKDVGEAEFQREVIAASAQRPVVVDFWAPWCAPCRVLGPVLEAEISALSGQVDMVKVNTDESPNLAAQFGIQGIPAVKAFRNGQIVAEFTGAKPAAFVRDWLAGLAPAPGQQALLGAEEAVRAGRATDAETLLRPLLDDETVRDRAALGLARVLAGAGRMDEVPPVLARIDPHSAEAEAIPAIERVLAFATDARAFGGEDAARVALDGNPKDMEARWALAGALAARGATAQALDQWIEIVSRNRKFRDDGARLAMLAVFDQLGHDHPLTQEYRRKLQVVL